MKTSECTISCHGISQVHLDHLSDEILNFRQNSAEKMKNLAISEIEKYQRQMLQEMEITEIIKNRKEFSKRVFDSTKGNLKKLGIILENYLLKDLMDEDGYLRAIAESQNTIN